MKDINRDLWVLCKSNHMSQSELDREVALLNTLLYQAENWQNFCTANEVIDVNRRKIIQKSSLLQDIIGKKNLKAFVFLNNKN